MSRLPVVAVVGATANTHSADFAPLLTQECDIAVAAGTGVAEALAAAGRSPDTVVAWSDAHAVAADLASRAVAAAAERAGLPIVAMARAMALRRATVLA